MVSRELDYWPADMPTLHVCGQEDPHDEIRIVGTRDALMALWHAIRRAIDTGNASTDADIYTNDGEGFRVTVERTNSTGMRRLPAPYGLWPRPEDVQDD